ncbi:MAG: hypothetical protein HY403_11465 [Elusimicrobia bacterium]|nr:hypothetical protein [Elusimicrobiota bacterium]
MNRLLPFLLLAPLSAAAQRLEDLPAAAGALFDGSRRQAAPPAVSPAARAADAPLSLSDLARALGRDPAAVDELLDLLVAKTGSLGSALDTPALRARIKEALSRADPSVLDRFPTLTPAQAGAAASLYASRQGMTPEPARPEELALTLPGAPLDPPKDLYLKPIGRGLLYGDETLFGAGAPWGDSRAVAEALNHLSANDPSAPAGFILDAGARRAGVGAWLDSLLSAGHVIEIDDVRLYANFGDLRLEAGGARRDVATPTLIDTGIVLPSGRRLVSPVAHSELDIRVRGPRVNASLAFYYGIDGRAAFRAKDTTNQGWVGGRVARSWSGKDAAALLERAAWVSRELAAKAKAFGLAMGGYGPLGDCNDAHAFITGSVPFGMLREPRYYAGDSELDRLSRSLPHDLIDAPDPRRVWDSRPFERAEDVPMAAAREALLELGTTLKQAPGPQFP